ncbi:MAG: hypothetical protein LWX56_09760 [Ignavibacteria bacterium]|nr:hypothetical protein [Ignavibacteria bacterium]
MGEKLLRYYKFVAEEKGIGGKLELAKKTKIPSSLAALQPDSKENVAMFIQAVKEITGKTLSLDQ